MIEDVPSNSFIATASDVLKTGLAFVASEVFDARIALCSKCPHRDIAQARLVCGFCGCYMSVKARFVATRCPVHLDW
ncbi:hypothetical protein [Asticcacaulis excentricus]|uniref:hypothetical protein n=1 Tax=Asticcacaulis excentricus TaxID=78587 RepID=UPI000F82517F|nr:hypothetical protein [Asticcacaulis excentricus]